MIFFVYTLESSGRIDRKLGAADYSYFFVMKLFLPVLEKLGRVVIVKKLGKVDKQYKALQKKGERAVVLSFAPPHKTPTELNCPVIPVFAWEYSTIPNESWANDWRHNWTEMLSRLPGAITHSRFAQTAVEAALGSDYPIASLPAPLWDKFATMFRPGKAPELNPWRMQINGIVIDSHSSQLRQTHVIDAPVFAPKRHDIELSGVIYTSVFNPNDGRKNWTDLLSAFCFAFREQPNAVLILKLAFFDDDIACSMVWSEIKKNAPFQCRVVAIQGYLNTEAYRSLVANTSYIVNSSYGEGQCLPLMEFMSAGKPAIAPDHSGMADYIDSKNAFVVRSSREWTHWPHDPRLVLRAFRYRIDWQSLRTAFIESFAVAQHEPERYTAMAGQASHSLKAHAGRVIIEEGLVIFFRRLGFELSITPPQTGSWGWITGMPARLRRVMEKT